MKRKIKLAMTIIVALVIAVMNYNGKNNVSEGQIEYRRDDWESSAANTFYDPIRCVNVGLKNYKLYLDTQMDITSDGFQYVCPYSNEVIYDYKKVEWDHIIPLYYVHCHGGDQWTRDQKVEYCYNMDNGVNVSMGANRSKGAKGPSEWLPECNQEWYCQKWLEIADRYNIDIDDEDMRVINNVLGR